jgi:hypothetical protein
VNRAADVLQFDLAAVIKGGGKSVADSGKEAINSAQYPLLALL